jgi:pimeloyl-ACP methyl ester carboxylesterase
MFVARQIVEKKVFHFSWLRLCVTARPSDPSVLNYIDDKSGAIIKYTKEGNDESNVLLVAIHGGPGSLRDYRHMCGEFLASNANIAVVRFNLPGYGGSDQLHKSAIPTTPNYTDIIARALDNLELPPQYKRVVFMGHSLGGHIAVSLCHQYYKNGKSTGLVLLAPACATPGWNIGGKPSFVFHKILSGNLQTPVIGKMMQNINKYIYVNTFGFPDSIPTEEFAYTYLRLSNLDWDACGRQANELGGQTGDEGPSVAPCPWLQIYAKNDRIIPPYVQEELAALLPASSGKKVILPGGGHFFPRTKSSETARIVKEWIDSLRLD